MNLRFSKFLYLAHGIILIGLKMAVHGHFTHCRELIRSRATPSRRCLYRVLEAFLPRLRHNVVSALGITKAKVYLDRGIQSDGFDQTAFVLYALGFVALSSATTGLAKLLALFSGVAITGLLLLPAKTVWQGLLLAVLPSALLLVVNVLVSVGASLFGTGLAGERGVDVIAICLWSLLAFIKIANLILLFPLARRVCRDGVGQGVFGAFAPQAAFLCSMGMVQTRRFEYYLRVIREFLVVFQGKQRDKLKLLLGGLFAVSLRDASNLSLALSLRSLDRRRCHRGWKLRDWEIVDKLLLGFGVGFVGLSLFGAMHGGVWFGSQELGNVSGDLMAAVMRRCDAWSLFGFFGYGLAIVLAITVSNYLRRGRYEFA